MNENQIKAEKDNLEQYAEIVFEYDKTATPMQKHQNRGQAYCELEKWDLGIAEYKKAAEISPELSTNYYNLGVAHVRMLCAMPQSFKIKFVVKLRH